MPDRYGCNVCADGSRQQGQPCSAVLGACDRTQNLICQYPNDPNVMSGVCEYGKHIKSFIHTSAQKRKSSVNDTLVSGNKSAEHCEFVHIYWRNSERKTSFLCSVKKYYLLLLKY